MITTKIVSIGEILWDVFPDSERLGGAPFNFAAHAHRLGHNATFIGAVGDDERGRKALHQAAELGLSLDCIQNVPGAPTGYVSVRLDETGQPEFVIHRPAAYDALRMGAGVLARMSAWRPDWIYFGTLHQSDASAHSETMKLLDAIPSARRFYDVNLRRNSYTLELVLKLMSIADTVKLNEHEAAEIDRCESLQEFTETWSKRMSWRAVAVTRGAHGCVVRIGDDYAESPGYAVEVVDTVGAGDAFAAAFLHGLAQGWDAARTGDFANRLGAVVAQQAGGAPAWNLEDCWRVS